MSSDVTGTDITNDVNLTDILGFSNPTQPTLFAIFPYLQTGKCDSAVLIGHKVAQKNWRALTVKSHWGITVL